LFGLEASLFQGIAECALVLQRRQHEHFAGDELVAALLCQLVSEIEQFQKVAGNLHIAPGTFDLGQTIQHLTKGGPEAGHVDAALGQQRTDGAAVLIQQGDHDMHGLDELLVAAERQALRIRQGRLEFAGQFVHSHDD
jgi:hypothetical protein